MLTKNHGICYAKANLLTALLRKNRIPTGFLYQRLLLTDEEDGIFCIHALNAVFVSSINQWIKMDARGNKGTINAQFSLKKESLAFYPNEKLGEKTYNLIYSHPNLQTTEVLEHSNDALFMYMNSLPSVINI